jgi:hypothetical protein
MTYKVGFLSALALWVVTIATAGYFFVKGHTVASTDARIAVVLSPVERDQILAEMRQFLKAVHGVLEAIVAEDLNLAERSARTAGMAMSVDVNPIIIAKLPLTFKAMGMSVHRDFDALADGIQSGERGEQVLKRLSDLTSRCTACHEVYRFSTSK